MPTQRSGRADDHHSPLDGDQPAVRDAAAIVDRAAADEAAAEAARLRLNRDAMPVIEPDSAIARLLRRGERVFVYRGSATLRLIADESSAEQLVGGALYLTDARLLHIGTDVTDVPLVEIEELSVAGEQLMISLGAGNGLVVGTAWPRLLRVQIASTRAALRDRSREGVRTPGLAVQPSES